MLNLLWLWLKHEQYNNLLDDYNFLILLWFCFDLDSLLLCLKIMKDTSRKTTTCLCYFVFAVSSAREMTGVLSILMCIE